MIQFITNETELTADFLTGGGEMGARMREMDWENTPLGGFLDWPQSLKTTVQIMLNSRFPMFIWWGEDLTFLYNNAYLPTLGSRHPLALGKSARLVWAEIWDDLEPQVAEVLERNEATWNEEMLLFLERSGFREETYHTFSYSPIPSENNSVGGLFCAVTEETARVLSRRRLQTLRELGERALVEAKTVEDVCRVAAATIENHPRDLPFALIYLLDENQKDARLCQAVRISAGDSAAPSAVELNSITDIWNFYQVLKTGESQVVENLTEKFGKLSAGTWLDDSTDKAFVAPLTRPGTKNSAAGFLVAGISPRQFFDDDYRSFLELVTERIATAIANVSALAEERKRSAALAEIDRAKTEFFSNVSHEFRTPLTLMLGTLEEVLHESNVNIQPTERDKIETAHRNSLRLLKLVNNLLDFSRIEAGKIQAVFESTDLSQLTTELADAFRSAIENANLKLKIDCEPLLQNILVDQAMWEKIVLNLLSNAFKFTFSGEIAVSLREIGEIIELEISDTGVGIPAAELPNIFERFHRVSSTTGRSHEGSGIGLALVQELVKQHNGEIAVTSELGQGSTFVVLLPKRTANFDLQTSKFEKIAPAKFQISLPETNEYLSEVEILTAFQNEILSAAENPKFKIQNPILASILLADDNADMRNYVRRLLETAGYAVTAVNDGRAALDSLRENLPDLILTDVMMPHVDGFGLLEAVRAESRAKAVPIIMISARAGENFKIEGLKSGADDYLVKPFSANELLARVQSSLERAQKCSQAAELELSLRLEAEIARENFEQILAGISDGFIALDREWRFVYLNSKVAKIIERDEQEMLGKNLWDEFPGLEETEFGKLYHRAVDENIPGTIEDYYAPFNAWFNVRAYPNKNGLAIFFLNITERKRAEQAVDESRETLSLAMRSSQMGAWARDLTTEAVYWSPELEHIFGLQTGTFSGHINDFYNYVYEADREMLGREVRAALSEHREYIVEFRFNHKSGEVRWMEGRGKAIYAAEGKPTSVYGIGIDITERKKAEREREQLLENEQILRREAEAANRLKDEFLATVSHELRTPLNAILGWTLIARNSRANAEMITRAFDIIERNGRNQNQLISDILDVSRIITGKLSLEIKQIELTTIVKNSIESLRPALENRQIRLKTDLKDELMICGDENRLQQIVWNLLSNAIKFTEPGGEINVSTASDKNTAKISVSDSGEGISPEFLPFVFDRFRQADGAANRRHGGLGLGLAIVRHLSELHGGTVSVESAGRGEGATFVVQLPLLLDALNGFDEDQTFEKLSAQTNESSNQLLQNLKILVVDDEPDAREFVSFVLTRHGAQVMTADSTSAALEKLNRAPINLLISDIGMPDQDGYFLIRQIRAKNNSIPAIALTAYAGPQDGVRALAAGYTAHLPKPVAEAEIIAAVITFARAAT